jgi:hypothetical protein
MIRKLLKSTGFIIALLLVVSTFVAAIPMMIAGTPAYEVFINLPPVPAGAQQDWVVEVFNWQAAYGKPWEWEAFDAHLGDIVSEWWDGNTKYGAKVWVELDKVAVIYNYHKPSGTYNLVGMIVTVGDPTSQEAHDVDVWEHSLVQDGDGSFSMGTFKWLGAEEAQWVVDYLMAWVADGNPMNEDMVKAVTSDVDYFWDRAYKPHI